MNRKEARECAFILLFEASCKRDETAEEIFEKATAVRELVTDEFARKVFFGAYENSAAIDDCIEKCLKGREKKRVSVVSQAILKLAVYELMFLDDIPPKVSINEAIELSKKYDDETVYSFVNGVLNSAAVLLGRK